jgi:hypothetical protein
MIRHCPYNMLDNKAVALNNLGNHTGPVLYYNEALAIDPKDPFALTNKAAILDRLGNQTTTGNLTTSQATNEITSGNAITSTVKGPNPNATAAAENRSNTNTTTTGQLD